MVSPLTSLVANLGPQKTGFENIGQDIQNLRAGNQKIALQEQALNRGQRLEQQEISQESQTQNIRQVKFINALGKRLLQTDETQWPNILQPHTGALSAMGFDVTQLGGFTRDEVQAVVAQTDAVIQEGEGTELERERLRLQEKTIDERRRLALERPELAGQTEAAKLEAQIGRKADVAREVTQATGQARISTAIVEKSFEKMGQAQTNITNIDRAIAAIDKGAKTGAIQQFLPSIRTASRELDQIKNELGLDIVGAVTFGALSKGELTLALDTALPTGLDEPQLREWLERKREAQIKVMNNLREAALFLSEPGNTVADFVRSKQAATDNSFTSSSGIEFTVE